MDRHWINLFQCENLDVKNMYVRKLSLITDTQLSEFNFQVMNRMLPCNVNLVWLQKKEVETCNICGINESIDNSVCATEHVTYYIVCI